MLANSVSEWGTHSSRALLQDSCSWLAGEGGQRHTSVTDWHGHQFSPQILVVGFEIAAKQQRKKLLIHLVVNFLHKLSHCRILVDPFEIVETERKA